MRKKRGAAARVPTRPARPSPLALPVQTVTAYSGVHPLAQASRKPKLVPVFQATGLGEVNLAMAPSSSGRWRLVRASRVAYAAPALIAPGVFCRLGVS